MFLTEDFSKLKKIGVSDVLSLALNAPKRYEDRRLLSFPLFHEFCLIEAHVKSVTKRPKVITAIVWAANWEREVEIVFFAPKPYHNAWLLASPLLFWGKVEEKFGKLIMAQPKKVGQCHEIVPIYATILAENSMRALIKRYVTRENLLSYGLPSDIIDSLLILHFPSSITAIPLGNMAQYPLKYTEIFRYFTKMSNMKKDFPSCALKGRSSELFIRALPFSLTDDQCHAIADITSDLAKNKQAKRVIVGDVGCGKTLVILAVAFMTFPKRAVLLAPTSLLANQLYEEAQKFLPSNIKTSLLTQKTKVMSDELRSSHFIIGTHALLYRDIPDIAVMMIDEQHRFGTLQRQLLTLGNEKVRPHFFQFTATPIPRTLALIESEMVDFSFIKQIPFEKQIISHVIGKSDFSDLLDHIRNEIDKKKQTIIVYPLVEKSDNFDYQSIEEGRGFWENRFEEVYVTHGRDKAKEEVLKAFREKGNILLATTVIEVGISLPRLSTIVIVGAERLGLASLHQLRGRVGRNGGLGYCFLFTYSTNNTRLNSFCQLQNGFEVAELDLQYRQSGDLLEGLEQSGEPFRWINFANDSEIIERAKNDYQR